MWPYEILGTREHWMKTIKVELEKITAPHPWESMSAQRDPDERRMEFGNSIDIFGNYQDYHPRSKPTMKYCNECKNKLMKLSDGNTVCRTCIYPSWATIVDENILKKGMEYKPLRTVAITGFIHYGDIKKLIASTAYISANRGERIDLKYYWTQTSENTFFRPIDPIGCNEHNSIRINFTELGLSTIGLSYVKWKERF